MIDPDALLAFDAIATHGGLAAASRKLGIPKATLSRKLTRLERDVGVRLVQRTTRRLTLTEAGTVLHQHGTRVASELVAASAAVEHLQGGARGTLRVAAEPSVGRLLITPLLADFLVRHPDLRTELRFAAALGDPLSEGADVVITTRILPQQGLVIRHLVSVASHVYASPAYLRRRPTPVTPQDLAAHTALVFTEKAPRPRMPWMLWREGEQRVVQVTPVLVADDPVPLVAAAIAGRGLVLTSDSLAADEVRAGRLVQVLADWRGPEVTVRLYLSSRKGVAPKVRAFVDHLVGRLGTL